MGLWVSRVAVDVLEIRRRSSLLPVWSAVLLLTCWVALLAWRGASSRDGLALLAAGLVVVPWVAVRLARGLRPERRVLVRSAGKLLLDGQPLDVARIELRVARHPILRVPSGYALSLWGMELDGHPVDLELGRFLTMLDASRAAGELEEFLEVAKAARTARAR